MKVVWFKRDLRLSDHVPLVKAIDSEEPVLGVYIVEDIRIEQDDVSQLHIAWDIANARELSKQFQSIGGAFQIVCGIATEVFQRLNETSKISEILCHEETGLLWSWDRDKEVADWCEYNDIKFSQYPSNGVVRNLKNRDVWNDVRLARMAIPSVQSPTKILAPTEFNSLDNSIGIYPCYNELVDTWLEPGEIAANSILTSFVKERNENYISSISSPALSERYSSRLSAYLASGVLSVKQVLEAVGMMKIRITKQNHPNRQYLLRNLNAFSSRVLWRCHFIQRLEVEATQNYISLNPELDSKINRILDKDKFDAWKFGKTGWPFFDACMRSLTATGWINFRMRAMIQSVAAYTLWLPWKETGNHLANLFIDYEPGIHWSQINMQSGITGINAVRAYSIIKQSTDHDLEGEFIRKWVPELKTVPNEFIHEPWLMSEEIQQKLGVKIGIDYPTPIVDEQVERNRGIQACYAARKDDDVKSSSKRVYNTHGSRKKRNQKKKTSGNKKRSAQKSLVDF